MYFQGCRRRFREFGAIPSTYQNPTSSKVFSQNRPISDLSRFTQNQYLQLRKQLETHLQAFRRRFRAFGAIPSTYQNPPCSLFWKPWAMAQAFCSKSGNFRPLQSHPKSTQKVAQGARNDFRMVLEAFHRDLSDFQDLPKSAMFKSMGYSPGFLLEIGLPKICRFGTLKNSPEIFTNIPGSSWKSIYKHVGDVSGSLERFPALTKIRHVQNHGL